MLLRIALIILSLASAGFTYGQDDVITDSLAVPVEIRTSRSYDNGVVTIGRSQFLSFAGSFDDPSRLLMKYPGISTPNDQANAVIYHGLPSQYHQWQLYGARILNPNHLSNAGTFSDITSRSSGGVNMMSGQVIGQMNFYGNPSPKSFNSLAGNSDISLRSPYQNNINLNLSLIGMEAGVDRVWGKDSNQSLIANYRYSTVGLLTDFGLDFGGEVIGYQDITANYHLKTKSTGTYNIYALAGKSSNEKDTIQPAEEFKELNAVGYDKEILVLGANNDFKKGNLSINSALNFSTTKENYNRTEYFTSQDGNAVNVFESIEQMISAKSSVVKKNANSTIGINLLSTYMDSDIEYQLFFDPGLFLDGDKSFAFAAIDSRLETILSAHYETTHESSFNYRVDAGLMHNTAGYIRPVSSLKLSRKLSEVELTFDYSLSYQELFPELSYLYHRSEQVTKPIGSHSIRLGVQKGSFSIAAYFQHLFDFDVISDVTIYSPLEALSRFPLSISGQAGPTKINLRSSTANVYGADLSYGFTIAGIDIFPSLSLISGSQQINSIQVNIPNNFGHIANIRVSKKWKVAAGKYLGTSLAMHHRGGAYQNTVDTENSLDIGYTEFLTDDPYNLRLDSYWRADLRIYYAIKRNRYKSTISLDIQNVTNRENDAYYYYEPLTGASTLRKQLGLLPVLSWRVSF